LAIKQILQTIQNKIKLDKGISRRPVDATPGYLGDMNNFEYKNGAVVLRNGSRVMNHAEDNLWYDIKSFKICGTNVVMGLNYKRELWAWLDKWPETDFKVCNSSPFRTYRHVDGAGTEFFNKHFSIDNGTKFWLDEDAFSVIIFNDYGEIFRIMKNGIFKITGDNDYTDKTEALESIREDFSLTCGRLYLDIKNATNKIFNESMYIGTESIGRSQRITGETRFAWVNELGVISELSDPVKIDGYKNAIISMFPIVPFDERNKEFPVERIVRPQTYALKNKTIYEGYDGGLRVGAISETEWNPVHPYAGNLEKTAVGVVLAIKEESTHTNQYGVITTILPGIYLAVTDDTGNFYDFDKSEDYNYNIISLDFKNPLQHSSKSANMTKMFVAKDFKDNSFPRLYKSDFTKDLEPDQEYQNKKAIFSTTLSMVSGGSTYWIKLADSVPLYEKGRAYPEHIIVVADSGNGTIYIPNGFLFEVEFKIIQDNSNIKTAWGSQLIRGIELSIGSIDSIWSCWENVGFDCWQFVREITPSVDNINLEEMQFSIPDDIDRADLIVAESKANIWIKIRELKNRFATYNDSRIVGISQRCFTGTAVELIYYDNAGDGTETNYNIQPSNAPLIPDNIRISFLPFMSLDYTGLRHVPYTLPLIRRAIRNPQHLSLSGGKVYCVEDNRLWYGDASDMMLENSITMHSQVLSMCKFDSSVVLSTRLGLFYVSDVGLVAIIGGENIVSDELFYSSGGCIAINENEVYLIYKETTSSGNWYAKCFKISDDISNVNFSGTVKSISIGSKIYIADDWNVWIYDIDIKSWCGKRTYKDKIHRIWNHNEKLGLCFDSSINRLNGFDSPDTSGES